MVIGEALRELDSCAELAQAVFKTIRRRDATKGTDIGVSQPAERKLIARVNILEIKRLVGALDNLGGAVIAADARDQLIVRLAGAFG